MKHLAPHVFDDVVALDLLEGSRANIRFLMKNGLKDALAKLYCEYHGIVAKPDDAKSKIKHLPLTSAVLIAAYEDPPTAIEGLKSFVQEKLSPNVCPMCGSLKTGTADHYLPKSAFPEYSFYSWNLVPACDCNSMRGDTLVGVDPDEYVMHPFFQPLMSQRIISAVFAFAPGSDDPNISIGKLYPAGLPAAAVDFHISSIHARTTMLSWMTAEWGRLLDVPLSFLTWVPRKAVITMLDLQERLEDVLYFADDKLATPNNWTSALLHGVLNSPEAMERLLRAIDHYRASTGT